MDFIFFIPIWVIIIILLFSFVLGKMIFEGLIKVFMVLFGIVVVLLIAKLIKSIFDRFYSDDDDDWSWEDN